MGGAPSPSPLWPKRTSRRTSHSAPYSPPHGVNQTHTATYHQLERRPPAGTARRRRAIAALRAATIRHLPSRLATAEARNPNALTLPGRLAPPSPLEPPPPWRHASHRALSNPPRCAHQSHTATYHQLERRPLVGTARHRRAVAAHGAATIRQPPSLLATAEARDPNHPHVTGQATLLQHQKGSQLYALPPRSAGRCRPEVGVPSRPRASSHSALRRFAPLRGAVPTRGRRSKPSPRFFSLGRYALPPRSAGRCRPEAGVPSRPRDSSHSALRAFAPLRGAVPV